VIYTPATQKAQLRRASVTTQANGPAASQPAVTTTSVSASLKLRVASYNVLYGSSPKRILSNIESVKPDVVLLQEASLSAVQMFARSLGMEYQFGPYKPGVKFGMAVLSRGKMETVKLFSMKGENNFAIAANVSVGGREMLIVSVHWKPLPRPLVSGLLKSMGPHKEQARMILELVRQSHRPAIVGGDLNTLSFTPEYLAMTAVMRDCASETGTSSQPSIFVSGIGYRVDHIFVHGPWRCKSGGVSQLGGSDHRLIYSDLELP